MAAFGIDPALLIVDEAELARLRAATPRPDFRQVGNLERELEDKQENLRIAEVRLQEVAESVVELADRRKRLETAHEQLKKTIGGSSTKVAETIEGLTIKLQEEQEQELRRTAIVTSLKNNIENFLAAGPPSGSTNGDLITASKERERALRAASL